MPKTTHRMTKTPEYKAWDSMKQRCFNPNHKRYSDWGGRGIKVCDRWKNSSENFLADMGLKPTPKHSLDRIDNDGDYCPENCRWATKAEQENNRRNNKPLITIGNETYTIAQWAKKMSISEFVIHTRLKMGWSEYDAVMTPINGKIRLIAIENETYTIAQWTEEKGYSASVIKNRLRYGWSEYDAVMTPVHTDKLITIDYKTYTIAQWTEEKGYSASVIKNRLKLGWSEYDAVMTPVHVKKA